MGAQHVGPAHQCSQPVGGSQFNARAPFVGADAAGSASGYAGAGVSMFCGGRCGASCHIVDSCACGFNKALPDRSGRLHFVNDSRIPQSVLIISSAAALNEIVLHQKSVS
jgi:hypothetical protein